MSQQDDLEAKQSPVTQQEVPPKDDDKEEPEGTQEVEGKKLVPLGALHEERNKRKALAKEVADLKATKQELDDLKASLQTIQPQLKILQDHPELVDKIAKQSAEGSEQPEDDPDAEEIAETLGLFTQDGELDIKRGRKVLATLEKRAGKVAEKKVREEVGPVRSRTNEDRAALLRERALRARDDQGRRYADPGHVNKVLDLLPAEMAANEQVVQLALVIARGLSGAPADDSEPLFTEAPGGRRRGAEPMSAMEKAMAKLRGMSDEKWRKARDGRDDGVLE